MEKFLKEANELAYIEVEKTNMPIKQHVDLAKEIGKRIAKELNANTDIVEAGTLLMDCLIGQALKENRSSEHVQMSLLKANELLEKSSLEEAERNNIRHCIEEHHGVEKFYSLESEICCNADCYRFVSIRGFTYALRYLREREMPFEDLIKLLNSKVDEKWNAISLDIVREELKPQYEIILGVLRYLKES